MLAEIRPFIRNIDTSSQIDAFANGDLRAALAYHGNVVPGANISRSIGYSNANMAAIQLPEASISMDPAIYSWADHLF